VKIPIHYFNDTTELEVSDGLETDLFDSPAKRLERIPADHWLNQGDLPDGLRSFLKSPGQLLVVVNDNFRPTPTARILIPLAEHLDLSRTTFLVATGLHPQLDDESLAQLFGELYAKIAGRVMVHDSQDDSASVRMGSGKGKVWLNSALAQADRILTIGSVEPHYFAGFTGGRKIILPGCASLEDVRINHGLAVSPASRPLATKGNPVWEDIQERTRCLDEKPRYTIQVVTAHQGQIYLATHGDWDQAYIEACDYVTSELSHHASRYYDVVVSVVYPPLDKNLYQLQKSYENVAGAVRAGGTILLISSCYEGVGDDRFLRLAEAEANGLPLPNSDDDLGAIGIHKIRRTTRLARRIDLELVSLTPPEVIRHLPIRPRADFNTAMKELTDRYGENCRVAVVLDSASQVLSAQAESPIDSTANMEEKRNA
jgi:nickel-dependent lactate racemase